MTAEIIRDLKNEYTPTDISSAVAMMVGIWSLLIGLLGLGFLLDYVSIPVLTGFISATAFVIGMGQVGSLVGLSNVPDGAFNQLANILRRLPYWDGPTCGIGFGTVVVLLILEQVGKRWGNKHFAIRYMSSSRAIIVMVIFTLISYLVNKDRDDYLWGISEVNTHGIQHPKAPGAVLLSKVIARSIAPLVACTLEHQAVGKAFARRNHYAIDQTQEFNYLGVTNIINSFFGVMPVGGAISRTAVNSECKVRSPLNGAVTAGFIILTLYVFSPALYWLPKATLSAIIVSIPLLCMHERIADIRIDHGCHPPLRTPLPDLAILAHLARRLHRVHGRLLGNNLRISRNRHWRGRRVERGMDAPALGLRDTYHSREQDIRCVRHFPTSCAHPHATADRQPDRKCRWPCHP